MRGAVEAGILRTEIQSIVFMSTSLGAARILMDLFKRGFCPPHTRNNRHCKASFFYSSDTVSETKDHS